MPRSAPNIHTVWLGIETKNIKTVIPKRHTDKFIFIFILLIASREIVC